MKPWKVVLAFVVAAVLYGVLFVGCVGTESGSTASSACGAVGPLLKGPFLHALPYANSRYFGIDALILFTTLNMLFWGSVAAGLTWWVSKRRAR
jgi:hypothetical protein